MNRNQPTTYIDLNEENEDILESEEDIDFSNTLTSAYADLGKAFYEYRFEEPTPELLLYFDRITDLLKTTKEAKRQREDHMEPMSARTASQGDYKVTPSFHSPDSPSQKDSFEFKEATTTHKENEYGVDPDLFSQNYFNEPVPDGSYSTVQSNWKESQNPNNNFWDKNYKENVSNKTFVMFESQSSLEPEKPKKGSFSPFRKKEKDRVSSLDDLPNIDKGYNTFPQNSEPIAPKATQSLFCPACGNPVAPGDGFCGNCGSRLTN